MELNIKDTLIQKRFPTVMVPKYGELEPCPLHQTRLLMARDGVYIETNQPFGKFMGHLAGFDRDLPYGDVEPANSIVAVLATEEVKEILYRIIKPAAEEYAVKGHEWAGWIVWNEEEGCQYLPLDIETTAVSVIIRDRPVLPEGTYLIADVHSHGRIQPFFSNTDDADDAGGVKASLVLGSYNGMTEKFKVEGRIVIEGFYFPLFNGKNVVASI